MENQHILLVDGDLVNYRIACGVSEKFIFQGEEVYLPVDGGEDEGKWMLEGFMRNLYKSFGFNSKLIVAFSHKKNYRKDINPLYKANRTQTRPDYMLKVLKEHAHKLYRCVTLPYIEADDTLGILMSRYQRMYKKHVPVIVTLDKDLKQIQGYNYRWETKHREEEFTYITYQEAMRNLFKQTLMGDSTDGFYGAFKIGEKKAREWVEKYPIKKEWSAKELRNRLFGWCKKLYEIQNAKYPEKASDIMLNYKMALILTETHYDMSKRKLPNITWKDLVRF